MAEQLQYKCPCCGGSIEFDSTIQKMKCPFCDTEFETETLKAYDEVLQNEQPDDMTWNTDAQNGWQEGETEGMRVYICESCGGEIIAEEVTGATRCPFCDNPVIMSGQFADELRPDCIIPFQLDKQAAKEAFKRHLKGKHLLPKVFKNETHIDEIQGVYVPFWLFDADAEADMRYRATRVRSWSDSNYIYNEVSHFLVLRSGTLRFAGVPADGSSRIADELMESIEPYNIGEAVDFQTAYLSGYLADRYDVSAESNQKRANERIRVSTGQMFDSTVTGYATVAPEKCNIRLTNSKARYALYPVWLMQTSWNGQQYTFAMNGQTGKFVGNLPVDKGAYWKWLGGLTVGYGLLAFVIGFLSWVL